MELTSSNVDTVLEDCLFDHKPSDAEKISSPSADGIMATFHFDPKKLSIHKEDICSMLAELPDAFQQDGGGGMSFLNACITRSGNQWGEHRSIDLLFMLGMAIGKVKCCFSREMWNTLPGGMPYYVVLKDAPAEKQGMAETQPLTAVG
jgi:hypothetical protein